MKLLAIKKLFKKPTKIVIVTNSNHIPCPKELPDIFVSPADQQLAEQIRKQIVIIKPIDDSKPLKFWI